MIKLILEILNKCFPKNKQIFISCFPDIEASAIEVANYLARNYSYPIFFATSGEGDEWVKKMLEEKVQIVKAKSLTFYLKVLTSKYIFVTHGLFLNSFPESQKICNLWHGIYYKPIRCLLGRPGLPADVTAGSSPLTQKMFAKAFDVPPETVVDFGFPRNDIMLRSKNNKNKIMNKIFKKQPPRKMILWLPTYRRSVRGDIRKDGVEVGNPFYIKNLNP